MFIMVAIRFNGGKAQPVGAFGQAVRTCRGPIPSLSGSDPILPMIIHCFEVSNMRKTILEERSMLFMLQCSPRV
jgi:hypothetical protein